jgi:sugar/nucleoside kinase (ribokinase family)
VITGIGCIAYDHVLYTNSNWADGKGAITKEEYRFGGNVRNSLAAVAALGEDATYLGTLSPEPEWAKVIEGLKGSGINTDYVGFKDGSHPPIATVIVLKDSERYIAFDDSPLWKLALPPQEKISAALEKTKLVLIDLNTAPQGTLAVVREAKKVGIPVVLDAERDGMYPDEFPGVLELSSESILPLNYAKKLAGENEIQKVLAKLWNPNRTALIVTDGPNGSYAITSADQAFIHTPAFKVEAIDSNGTGDVFHGAYAVARVRGESVADAILYATAAAASFIALPQGALRVPSEDAIKKLLASSSR